MGNLEKETNEGKQMSLFKCVICGSDSDKYSFDMDRYGKYVWAHWCLSCRPSEGIEKDI